ncbi:alpha/beta fold hydrolase [Mycobacterium riyadhense]|uniref:Alpha/beta hydrolase n=1 Tax=Mycobacterium riyadhense TaxID=486698 RepID=A0A653EWW7_9MYCO|nr:hypothetical protein [Mycobacterium riyadhense]VTP02035.1 hypothetical protein BIN_B_04325 [Mycobacterium riyadhense]
MSVGLRSVAGIARTRLVPAVGETGKHAGQASISEQKPCAGGIGDRAETSDRAVGQSRMVHRVVYTRDGVRIAAYDSGPADAAQTIVLLHGLCLSSQSWSATADLLLALLGDSVHARDF